jgi:hypothetical protein
MKKKGIFVIILILLLAAVSVTFFIVKNSGTYTWYVEPELEERWTSIVTASPPPGKYRVLVYTGDEKQRRALERGPSILITTKRAETPEKARIYYALSFDLEYEGALTLALDPWMVFQKHTDSSLTLDRLNNGGRGLLLLPGAESEARQAWTARLLQEGSGKFSQDPDLWIETERGLFDGNRFPADAPSASWPNVLSRLLSGEPAWLYAPLSVIRGYSSGGNLAGSSEGRTSILEAVTFPENITDGQTSLQAKLLWAIPGGTDKQKAALEETIAWLKDPGTQTIIADELHWIPAVPYGKPYNPVSNSSYLTWLTTAYIYELP